MNIQEYNIAINYNLDLLTSQLKSNLLHSLDFKISQITVRARVVKGRDKDNIPLPDVICTSSSIKLEAQVYSKYHPEK